MQPLIQQDVTARRVALRFIFYDWSAPIAGKSERSPLIRSGAIVTGIDRQRL
jgi:hypothetical protein